MCLEGFSTRFEMKKRTSDIITNINQVILLNNTPADNVNESVY